MSPAYYVELEKQLRKLSPLVAEAVPSETVVSWWDEFLTAGEYGLAVETVADELAKSASAVAPTALAESLLEAAERMGLSDPVVGKLRGVATGKPAP